MDVKKMMMMKLQWKADRVIGGAVAVVEMRHPIQYGRVFESHVITHLQSRITEQHPSVSAVPCLTVQALHNL